MEQENIDLIILDLILVVGEVSGYEMCLQIKRDSHWKSIRLNRSGDCLLSLAEEAALFSSLHNLLGRYIFTAVSAYAKNAGAVFSVNYHLVWCPKYRRPVLRGLVEKRLKALLKEKIAELEMTIHAMEVMPDHVPIFVESDPRFCVAEIAARFKGYTSHVLRQEFALLRSRLPTLWSRRYFAATVGSVTDAAVRKHIEKSKRTVNAKGVQIPTVS